MDKKIVIFFLSSTFCFAANEQNCAVEKLHNFERECELSAEHVCACDWCKNQELQQLAATVVVLPLIGWIAHNSFASFYVYKAGLYQPAMDE